jgi:hypothetical protein
MLVKTNDLLHCCPIWVYVYGPGGMNQERLFWRRARTIREAWSHKIVEIDAPVGPHILLEEPDYMALSLWFFRSYCQSTVYWKVIGPDELLTDLATDPLHPGPGTEHLNDLSLYLCQHEIRGD